MICNSCGQNRSYLNEKGICLLCERAGKSIYSKEVSAKGETNTKPMRSDKLNGI